MRRCCLTCGRDSDHVDLKMLAQLVKAHSFPRAA
jgi:hypothetical protein